MISFMNFSFPKIKIVEGNKCIQSESGREREREVERGREKEREGVVRRERGREREDFSTVAMDPETDPSSVEENHFWGRSSI